MIDELFAEFDGAFAENTTRGYRADFTRFARWCRENEIEPLEATSEDLAHFAEMLATTCVGSRIRRHVASISSILKLRNNA